MREFVYKIYLNFNDFFSVEVKDLRLTGSIQIDQDHNKDVSVKHLLLDIRFGGSTVIL